MNFKKLLINKKTQLVLYKSDIFNLFRRCFNCELDEKLWQWAYLDNPFGDPIISLYFDKDILVGHYAVIPLYLKQNDEIVKSALSMTTMVDFSYRKLGLFQKQAEAVYQEATNAQYELIFGFPNKKSAPGFEKRLGWKVIDCYIAELKKEHLNRISGCENKKLISVDVGNSSFMQWRLTKPGQNYTKNNNLVTKEYKDNVDILYHEGEFKSLPDCRLYNILIVHDEQFRNREILAYKFGYKELLNSQINFTDFKVDLLMSDVF